MLSSDEVRTSAADAVHPETIEGLKELWAETRGDPRICVAILDGPVDQSHPCIVTANLTRLETVVPERAGSGPASRHGTHVASVIFGQQDGPVQGIAPDCSGLIVPVFSDESYSSFAACSQLDLARAITQAAESGARIINISGGEFSPSGTAHPLLADAVRSCAARNILIVAAAGNEGCECLHVPGALPSVLAVGGMDAQGAPLLASNWGDKYRVQAVLALGEGILGASPGGGTTVNAGTSYAAAVVSGVASLLVCLQLIRGEEPDPWAVRTAILSSAVGCEEAPVPDCRRLLAGRLNIPGAVSEIVKRGGRMMSDSEETPEEIRSQGQRDADPSRLTDEPSATAAQDESGRSPSERSREDVTRQGAIRADSPGAQPRQAAVKTDAAASPTGVHASDCGCLKGGSCSCRASPPGQLVFALGTLGYDFGGEARRDSILQHMKPSSNAHDPTQLLPYLKDNPWDAAAIIWTLSLDATPIYAIRADGAFASEVYQRLQDFLEEQTRGQVERVSVPGYVRGSVRLFTGQVVPVIWPEPRGMYSWNTAALVEAVCGARPPAKASKQEGEAYVSKAKVIENFLRRVYHELRNLGMTPQNRAVNYAATNAFQIGEIFENALKDGMDLDSIEVERSPVCRPESDCWDVKVTFFNPRRVFEQARKVYRFAVDVSDVVPVMVGPVRSWFLR